MVSNIHTFGYYTWDLLAPIPQSAVHPFVKDETPLAIVDRKITNVAIGYNIGTFDTANTTIRVRNFALFINVTRICISGSIRLATQKLRCTIEAFATCFPSHTSSAHMCCTTREKRYLSKPTPRRTVPRHVTIFHRMPFEVSIKELPWFSRIWWTTSKHCVKFRRRKILRELELLYWCDAARNLTVAWLHKRKRSSWVTLRVLWPALCVAILHFSRL